MNNKVTWCCDDVTIPHSTVACPAGSYRFGEMADCQLCDVNTVSEAVSEGAGATTCTACGPGTESNTEHTVCGKSGTRDSLIISSFNRANTVYTLGKNHFS